MNHSRKLFGSLGISLIAVSLMLAGCEQQSSNLAAQPPSVSNLPSQEPVLIRNGYETSGPTRESAASPQPTPYLSTDHEAQVSANGETSGMAQAPIPEQPPVKTSPKPKVDASDSYKQDKPTLMGLELGADKDAVLARFSKPKDQFVMDEDEDALNVYEFTDFSIGFNKKGELEFVAVQTADIDPGLRGLRLGKKSADVIAALGKPDSNTTYVLAYKAQGTVLKLDMDPATDTIQSIKLFAAN